MYKVLIAPDSFKGTLSAREVCEIIGRAYRDTADCTTVSLPLADGGEGLCACMEKLCGGEKVSVSVTGVHGEKVTADYLMLPSGTAVIEMAAAAGLPMAGENNSPEKALTYGVGELLLHAAQSGAKSILLGLGGSATNDCGFGMAAALGCRFYGEDGLIPLPSGGDLNRVTRIERPEKAFGVPVICACDVENPLYGENGAAYVFAPQKGADSAMVLRLDEGLRNAAKVIKESLGKDVACIPGAGAAGGLGAGAVAFLDAGLEKGIDIILDYGGFEEKIREADLVISGEGRLDSQSMQGKVISGVAARCKKAGVPLITICGCMGDGWEQALSAGVKKAYFSCPVPKPSAEIKRTCREDLYKIAAESAEDITENAYVSAKA